jgi:hypothetical protein
MNTIFIAAKCHQCQPHKEVQYEYTSILPNITTTNDLFYNDCRQDMQFNDPIYGSYLIYNKINEITNSTKLVNPTLSTIGGDHTISQTTPTLSK